ncbi:hypothetical protein QBC46DRAFT_361945 [Diplogelasinospora grovesii]|uniref:Aminoglycoside phosphotransferase domain-containing protein n=1 Tax=Diplogelasinospora grovesii TaxID=303347 RepID=A0AAN6NCD5_9PEZI|nr:hypothetical protein QBC46DRAFT_361945 [Diplogelasinospora grovesii]
MSDKLVEVWINHEREFRVYLNRFYKRSLRPNEYQLDVRNKPYVPPKTDILVPDVLKAYDEEGSFMLVTKLLSGVHINKLTPEDQAVVMKEVECYIQTLRTLRSNRTGGPSGISLRVTLEPDLVFCHCDLSQSNIIEYGGYWPAFFKSPYFRDPRPSGA